MRITLAALVSLAAASPALAASGPFFSLSNTNFVVLISFILFLGILAYFKVPGMIGKMLDDRAAGIQSELDEARALREEAQTLLASYERKQAQVKEQAERIVAAAQEDAKAAAELAKADPDGFAVIDGSGSIDQVHQAVVHAVEQRFGI